MHLPLLSAGFAAVSLTLYVLLDGFDLGVGLLILFQRNEQSRDSMLDSITPTWDGNETWLIMAGVTMLAGFPIAYGILMPALYLPLIVMLLALGMRGVTFEFRAQDNRFKRKWDIVFGLGSAVAAAMQGVILGALMQGLSVRAGAFTGTVLDCFTPFSFLCSGCILLVYSLLGAAWLQLKGSERLIEFSQKTMRIALPLFVATFSLTAVCSFHVQPGITAAWHANVLALSLCSIVMCISAIVSALAWRKGAPGITLAATMAMTAAGIAGLAALVYPNIVPFRVSLWEASSPYLSQVFLMSGVCLVAPVVLAYSMFAYWIFRGRTPEKGWEL